MIVVSACATDDASKREVQELRAELRAVRETHHRLEDRMAKIENEQRMVAAAREPASSPPPEVEQPWTGARVPDLTVVKLKPKRAIAPTLDTSTAFSEPNEEALGELLTVDPREDRGATASAAAGENEAEPVGADHAYDVALKGLNTGSFDVAALKLQTFAATYPRHSKSDNALFYSGVALMSLDDIHGAVTAFERVLAEYPAGDARIEAMLRLGDCRLKLNQKEHARALFAKLISTYPGTAAADQAQKRLARITQ